MADNEYKKMHDDLAEHVDASQVPNPDRDQNRARSAETGRRNELTLSEEEVEAGTGRGAFDRGAPASDGHSDPSVRPYYRPLGIPDDAEPDHRP